MFGQSFKLGFNIVIFLLPSVLVLQFLGRYRLVSELTGFKYLGALGVVGSIHGFFNESKDRIFFRFFLNSSKVTMVRYFADRNTKV